MSSTGNSIAVREPTGALAIQAGQVEWDPMQLAALGQIGIKDAPDGDKQVFLHVSQRTGLDPFAKQIYMIPRNEKKREQRGDRWVDVYTVKWTIQTGIEGWRVIRDRAERRNGVRGIKSRFTYYDTDGNEHKVWVRRDPPVACEMTYTVVEPSGREVPYTSVLRFDEYVQKKDGSAVSQWATKPVHMLEKCTEADAYRCAFPQDYSGVVLDDTMPSARPEDMTDEELDAAASAVGYRPRVTGDQARERAAAARQAQVVEAEIVDSATREQVSEIWGHLDRLGHQPDKEWRLTVLSSILGRVISSSASLTADDADRLIADLERRQPAQMAPKRPTGAAPADDSAQVPQSPQAQDPAPEPTAPQGNERPPARASSGQRDMITGKLSGLGYSDSADDQAAMLRVITRMLGRTVRAMDDLDQDEARDVMRRLDKIKDSAALDAFLATLPLADEVPDGGTPDGQ